MMNEEIPLWALFLSEILRYNLQTDDQEDYIKYRLQIGTFDQR